MGLFKRQKKNVIPEVEHDPNDLNLPPGGPDLDGSDNDDADADIRGGPVDAMQDDGDAGFFDTEPAGVPDGPDKLDESGDVGEGPGEIRPVYPDPDPDQDLDGFAGTVPEAPDDTPEIPDESPEPDSDDDPDDVLAGMSHAGGRPKIASKPKKAKTPRPEKAGNSGTSNMVRRGLSGLNFKDDAARQTAFNCGCVTAGFCAILLVIFGTVFVCRTLRAQPKPVLANPTGNGNVYYDSGGRMHINVYMQREPDTEITVYVLPDGTVTTEKPEIQDNVRIVTMYVDQDGNITPDPPEKRQEPDAPENPGHDPDQIAIPASQVLYLDKNGQLVTAQPSEKPWRPITIITTQDGQTSIIPGEIQSDPVTTPNGDDQNTDQAEPVQVPPIILYILADGTVTTDGPGGDDVRKFTLDMSGGDLKITQDEITQKPVTPAEPVKNPEPSDYTGLDETGILAEARKRRGAGGSWFLDSDRAYTIIWGDTLGELSRRFGFSVDFLADYNGIEDKNLIFTGNTLRYPCSN